jgi:hypothetical protein
VPIRFVPEAEHVLDKNNSGKSSTIKFKISPSAKKMYKVLVEEGTKGFSNHIKVHKTILADCKVKEEAVVARSLPLANRRDIATLTVDDLVANQEEINNLVEANRELAETVCTLQKTCLTTSKSFSH